MASIPPKAFRKPPPLCRRNNSNMLGEVEENKSIIECLPTELLFGILLLLPADFLYESARFVCRKWHKIIHSDDFTNAQTRRSTNGLLLQSESNTNPIPIYVSAIRGRIQTSELSCTNRIMGCSNGLVMEVHDYDYTAVVTNPATKQPFLVPSIPPIDGKRAFCYRRGIAYSPASMVWKLTLPYYSPSQRIGLLILTAGVDRTWRNVDIGPSFVNVRPLFSKMSPVASEGFLHWWGEKDVFTLDVETETFTHSEIPLHCPFCSPTPLSTGRNIAVFCGGIEGVLWESWELEPKSGEWRNMASLKIDLRPLKSRLKPLLASRHGISRLLPLGWVKYPVFLAFRVGTQGRTNVFYNLVTHEIDPIELPDINWSYRAFPHRNNLVWLR